jgi:hypothetical protein
MAHDLEHVFQKMTLINCDATNIRQTVTTIFMVDLKKFISLISEFRHQPSKILYNLDYLFLSVVN